MVASAVKLFALIYGLEREFFNNPTVSKDNTFL